MVVAVAGLGAEVQAKKTATALEASFKERISTKISTSLEAALQHLVGRLGLEGQRFAGYELDLDVDAGDTWRHKCSEVDSSRDSIENCALRQLHGLAALCDGAVDLQKPSKERTLVDAHLKMLVSKEVPPLAMKRSKFDGVDIWFHRKTPESSSDDIDASPSLQASALMALVRCADATSQRDYFLEAENWFSGLQKVYPQKLWNSTLVSFHKSGIIWESLALVLSHVPAESAFHSKLLQYVRDFEGFLKRVWDENESTWSFASARALAIRWQSKALKGKKNRAAMKRWAQEHVDRFLGQKKGAAAVDMSEGILARIGGAGYTCGPLQGLTSLAAVVSNAELVHVVLQLLEKDIDRYQLSASNEGPDKVLARNAPLLGVFFRDEQQMKLEKRNSLRVDDVVQCMVAMTQALKTLGGIQGVVVDPETKSTTAADGRGTEL